MKSRNKLITAAIIAMMSSAMFTSCEDECVDCKNNMRVDAVYSTADATQTPVKAVKFDDAIIIYGEGFSNVNRVSVYEGDVEKFLDLNPTNVTYSSIIVKLADIETQTIDGIKLYSRDKQEPFVYQIKGYPDPIVNAFYCEFVPNGDVLKIGGNYLYGEPNSTLTAVTYDADGNTINAEVKSSDGKVMEIVLPAGTADGSVVTVTSASGSSVTSKCKIRDKSQVFLNFDDLTNQTATNYGAIDYPSRTYRSGATETYELSKVPTLTGNFAALTAGDGWGFKYFNILSYDAMSTNREGWEEKNLLDLTNPNPEYNYDSNDYLLKFEVFVPEDMPLKHEFIIAFSQYGAEDNSDGDFYNGKNFYCWDYLEKGNPDALPNGNLVFGNYEVTISADNGAPTVKNPKGFTTKGSWRTVAIPLTRDYFHYCASASSMWDERDNVTSKGKLEAKDFANMWIYVDPNTLDHADPTFFIAFDNFRIEKGTGCGLVLGQFGTGTTEGNPSGIDYFK